MLELIVLHRALQLFAHSCHNLVKGKEFHQDHEFFGDLYAAAEGRYDSTIERAIGLFGESDISLQMILEDVASELKDAPSVNVENNNTFYEYALKLENKILKKIGSLAKNEQLSQGTINLLVGHADSIEVETYKIKQRLK